MKPKPARCCHRNQMSDTTSCAASPIPATEIITSSSGFRGSEAVRASPAGHALVGSALTRAAAPLQTRAPTAPRPGTAGGGPPRQLPLPPRRRAQPILRALKPERQPELRQGGKRNVSLRLRATAGGCEGGARRPRGKGGFRGRQAAAEGSQSSQLLRSGSPARQVRGPPASLGAWAASRAGGMRRPGPGSLTGKAPRRRADLSARSRSTSAA